MAIIETQVFLPIPLLPANRIAVPVDDMALFNEDNNDNISSTAIKLISLFSLE